ncbi:hypothetical protein D3C77_259360 [compost metagenome]
MDSDTSLPKRSTSGIASFLRWLYKSTPPATSAAIPAITRPNGPIRAENTPASAPIAGVAATAPVETTAIAPDTVEKAVVNPPRTVAIFPATTSTGPSAASSPPMIRTTFCIPGLISAKRLAMLAIPSINGCAAFIAATSAGISACPIVIPTSFMRFHSIFN